LLFDTGRSPRTTRSRACSLTAVLPEHGGTEDTRYRRSPRRCVRICVLRSNTQYRCLRIRVRSEIDIRARGVMWALLSISVYVYVRISAQSGRIERRIDGEFELEQGRRKIQALGSMEFVVPTCVHVHTVAVVQGLRSAVCAWHCRRTASHAGPKKLGAVGCGPPASARARKTAAAQLEATVATVQRALDALRCIRAGGCSERDASHGRAVQGSLRADGPSQHAPRPAKRWQETPQCGLDHATTAAAPYLRLCA